ncbi:MAG: cytoplasmic protein [Actinobacteria bacterium]|nr:cytoplasmic protein [Actinomycetota bacterium]
MQTFLPYPDYEDSARTLDRQRLGKQRVEAVQILTALLAKYEHTRYGWQNHPATRMWEGHALSLTNYATFVCMVWKEHGYQDTCQDKICNLRLRLMKYESSFVPPSWVGRADFHESHQSNLLRKLPSHYGQFGWNVSPDLPYVWPSTKGVSVS